LAEHTLHVTRELIVKTLRSTGIECFVEGPGGRLANQKFDEPRWVWHHMGTTRMSAAPTDGVVDANCKVHGMENLYVSGSSLFPTCANDMPTLTLMALAHRLADHLALQLSLPSAANDAGIAKRAVSAAAMAEGAESLANG
jgi:choline dehydrogenase-like flavoprotein